MCVVVTRMWHVVAKNSDVEQRGVANYLHFRDRRRHYDRSELKCWKFFFSFQKPN